MRRRVFVTGMLLLPLVAKGKEIEFPRVKPKPLLLFPRDHGAHPEYRNEWWYVTGWLSNSRQEDLGFQITFFRTRLPWEDENPSRFAPRQAILAHAAISDPRLGRLRHDERAARAALGLAGAEEKVAKVWVDDWQFDFANGMYNVKIESEKTAMELAFNPRGVVLQGDAGFSRKGRRAEEASYYYSQPQLAVRGSANGEAVSGTAWLDHEWSSRYLAPEAAGWDWAGINLTDGGSLMAFRIRGKDGGVHFAPPGVSFEVLRTWKSPRTGASYPVSVLLNGRYRLQPLMDDQELDARRSTGTIYWEGAVRAFDGAREAGCGYLELTGYWKPMRL